MSELFYGPTVTINYQIIMWIVMKYKINNNKSTDAIPYTIEKWNVKKNQTMREKQTAYQKTPPGYRYRLLVPVTKVKKKPKLLERFRSKFTELFQVALRSRIHESGDDLMSLHCADAHAGRYRKGGDSLRWHSTNSARQTGNS